MNKKLANTDFEKLLEPFDATDIKYTGENEDNEFATKSFIANIKNNNYSEWIDSIKNSNEYVYDSSFEDYTKDTNYGQISININDKYITIEVKYNEQLDESTTLIESGIYPVALVGGADEAFLNVINEILGGNITEVDNLRLIPSLSFGGYGRYWYKANITLDEDTIINFISDKTTPETKRLLDSEELMINPYSDISIDCSANSAQYQPGISLVTLNDSNADMKVLNNESNEIGNEIITKLIEAEEKILNVLKKYEDIPEEDEFDESIIPINEKFEDGYDPETSDDGDPDAPYIPMQEPIRYNEFDIYKGIDEYDNEMYYIFFSGDPLPEPGYEEWQAETIEIAKEWCDSYEDPEDEIGIYTGGDPNDLDEREFESTIPIKESNEDDEIYNEEEHYQRNIYDILDNIITLANSYDDAENDEKLKKLGQTISRIEDELNILKKVHMDAFVGIKHIEL